MNFDFANPEFLWGLLLLPLLALLRGAAGKSGSLIFSSVAIAKEASRKNKARAGMLRFILTIISLALLIIAFARPRIGMGYSEREESGIDIVLAVDTSGSMAALDFTSDADAPITRLDAVKKVIEDFIKKRPNDRIGMVAFAVNPFLVSPMTLNHDWLLQNLERLDIGVIDPNRTAIGSAIGMSVNRLRDLKNAKSRVIILLTDGENNAGKISPIAAAEAAAAKAADPAVTNELLGEIRDLESARMAVEASLTGHFVFSTLHTNDAAGTVTRLIDMGVEPFLITSSLQGVVGQRLIRRICPRCKASFVPTDEDLMLLGLDRADIGDNKFYYGKGCQNCNNTGYKGRKALTEIFVMHSQLIDLVLQSSPTVVLRDKARELGMVTMREDGIQAVLNGETTMEEVLRYT